MIDIDAKTTTNGEFQFDWVDPDEYYDVPIGQDLLEPEFGVFRRNEHGTAYVLYATYDADSLADILGLVD